VHLDLSDAGNRAWLSRCQAGPVAPLAPLVLPLLLQAPEPGVGFGPAGFARNGPPTEIEIVGDEVRANFRGTLAGAPVRFIGRDYLRNLPCFPALEARALEFGREAELLELFRDVGRAWPDRRKRRQVGCYLLACWLLELDCGGRAGVLAAAAVRNRSLARYVRGALRAGVPVPAGLDFGIDNDDVLETRRLFAEDFASIGRFASWSRNMTAVDRLAGEMTTVEGLRGNFRSFALALQTYVWLAFSGERAGRPRIAGLLRGLGPSIDDHAIHHALTFAGAANIPME
jgi:hypothetical protein